MTQIAIDKQLQAIRNASAEAQKSRESAVKFLKDAGISNLTTPKSSSSQTVSHPKKK